MTTMATGNRSRSARPAAKAADPGLPMTAAELDAMQGDARRDAELERAKIMEDAVAGAHREQLPQLGGKLPAAETGPNIAPAELNPDPQQAAIEKAVAGIDWEAQAEQARKADEQRTATFGAGGGTIHSGTATRTGR